MNSVVRVKICGLKSVDEAVGCVELGADAIGLNFIGASVRSVDVGMARTLSRALRGRCLVVGVVADISVEEIRSLIELAELDCIQLHGDETDDTLKALLPHAYKAVRIATAADVSRARSYSGEHLLVDAKVEGVLGGSGATFDWSLVKELSRHRRITLAGGLVPDNVALAVREVGPYCVDVASGVEAAPGVKDLAKVEAFIAAARSACP